MCNSFLYGLFAFINQYRHWNILDKYGQLTLSENRMLTSINFVVLSKNLSKGSINSYVNVFTHYPTVEKTEKKMKEFILQDLKINLNSYNFFSTTCTVVSFYFLGISLCGVQSLTGLLSIYVVAFLHIYICWFYNIFSFNRNINQKIGCKTVSIRVVHCCRSFLFFFFLVDTSINQ